MNSKFRWLALAAWAGVIGCIDFRAGLQCRGDADCQGYSCVDGQCQSSDGGAGGGSSVPGYELSIPHAPVVAYTTGNDNCGPSGECPINPGDTGYVDIEVGNEGYMTLTGATATLATATTGATVGNGSGLQLADVSTGYGGCLSTTLTSASIMCDVNEWSQYPTVTLSASIPHGAHIVFLVDIADSSGNRWALFPPDLVVQ